MTTPNPFIQINPSFLPQTPTPPSRGRGAKRGRKPRGVVLNTNPVSHQPAAANAAAAGPSVVGGIQFTPVQWAAPTIPAAGPSTPVQVAVSMPTSAVASQPVAAPSVPSVGAADLAMDSEDEVGPSTSTAIQPGAANATTTTGTAAVAPGTGAGAPKLGTAGDEDGEGEDELLPAMADDDYSAQLSWQSESKDNLKCVLRDVSALGREEIDSDAS